MPLILRIETSCDETAAAVYCREHGMLSSVLFSQAAAGIDLHKKWGGVVPEVEAISWLHLEGFRFCHQCIALALTRVYWVERFAAGAFERTTYYLAILKNLNCSFCKAIRARKVLRGVRVCVDDRATHCALKLILCFLRLPVLLGFQFAAQLFVFALKAKQLFSELKEGILRRAQFFESQADLCACLDLNLVTQCDLEGILSELEPRVRCSDKCNVHISSTSLREQLCPGRARPSIGRALERWTAGDGS